MRRPRPAGRATRTPDELCPDENLANLGCLFKRLPDGDYGTCLIQPDGVEIRLADEFVRQGRNIDASDEAEGVIESIQPPADEAPPPAAQSTTG